MKYVIALAFEMEREAIATSIAGPQAAASTLGYSRMAFTAATLAEFIRAWATMPFPEGTTQRSASLLPLMPTCPFNRPASWLHRATQTLMSVGAENLDQFLLKVKRFREDGKRTSSEEF